MIRQPPVLLSQPVVLYTNQPVCPQQLAAGKELGSDSIEDDAPIAPAQATPQPPKTPPRLLTLRATHTKLDHDEDSHLVPKGLLEST